MTNEEINQKLAEFMGLCWHDQVPITPEPGNYPKSFCSKCSLYDPPKNPDYCSSSSPRSLLEGVITKVDNDKAVTKAVAREIGFVTYPVRAIAEQIARACVACIQAANVPEHVIPKTSNE